MFHPEFVQEAEEQSDSEPEIIREAQPAKAPNKRKEKVATKASVPVEVLALAHAWIIVSEDVKVGKD